MAIPQPEKAVQRLRISGTVRYVSRRHRPIPTQSVAYGGIIAESGNERFRQHEPARQAATRNVTSWMGTNAHGSSSGQGTAAVTSCANHSGAAPAVIRSMRIVSPTGVDGVAYPASGVR